MKPILKSALTILLLTHFRGENLTAQPHWRVRSGQVFDISKFPSDSFTVRIFRYPLVETEIVLSQLHCIAEPGSFVLWAEQRKGGKLLNSLIVGHENEGENWTGVPNPQPLSDYFIINDANEFTGYFYLFHKSGRFFKMTGGTLYLDKSKTCLLTSVSDCPGGCAISNFNLKTMKLKTKTPQSYPDKGNFWPEMTNIKDWKGVFEHSVGFEWKEN